MSVMIPLETDRIMETQVLPSRILPAQLRSVDGDQLMATLPLQTATSIGRAPDVGLRLGEDPYVSAHHAVITWDPKLQMHVITDTNSRNGIHVDDVLVTSSVRLANGSSIRLGMTELVYYAPRERR